MVVDDSSESLAPIKKSCVGDILGWRKKDKTH